MRCLVVAFWCLLISVSSGRATESETVTLTIRNVIERSALWIDTGGPKAVVLMHQSGSNPESWGALAVRLHQLGVSTLAPNSNSGEDALAAISFFQEKGKTDITLLGASIGGGAVQQAVGKAQQGAISRVILLSTATGPAMISAEVSKLFVHARGDFFLQRSVQSYAKASEPKRLLEFDGAEHGQDLLQGEHRNSLEEVILRFISDQEKF